MSNGEEHFDDFDIEELHFRDKWQFEHTSEFYPLHNQQEQINTLEFYFFIPNSLQINSDTYKKNQFYRDQTNLIRFKTPEFTFDELMDPLNNNSPLARIRDQAKTSLHPEIKQMVFDEIKLLGNILRVLVRSRIKTLSKMIESIDSKETNQRIEQISEKFQNELLLLRTEISDLRFQCFQSWTNPLIDKHFEYIQEFISYTISDQCITLLRKIRQVPQKSLEKLDDMLSHLILQEKEYREQHFQEPNLHQNDTQANEYLLYRSGLLNKFVLDPLLLKTTRSSLDEKYHNWIGSIAAAIAMLIYMSLFVWQGSVFIWNTEPFIVMTVFIYVLKDRLKEGIKDVSYRKAAQWFSDYTTQIVYPSEDTELGHLRESMSFVEESALPDEVIHIRNREFHKVLEDFKRPERIIYYKKTLRLNNMPKLVESRFFGLNILSRLNIHDFLTKAENPFHTYFTIDPRTNKIIKTKIPKVYHINIIIKNSYPTADSTGHSELRKFRLVVDKSGIKRVESITTQ
jgi:hypothetical protein